MMNFCHRNQIIRLSGDIPGSQQPSMMPCKTFSRSLHYLKFRSIFIEAKRGLCLVNPGIGFLVMPDACSSSLKLKKQFLQSANSLNSCPLHIMVTHVLQEKCSHPASRITKNSVPQQMHLLAGDLDTSLRLGILGYSSEEELLACRSLLILALDLSMKSSSNLKLRWKACPYVSCIACSAYFRVILHSTYAVSPIMQQQSLQLAYEIQVDK